VDKKRKSKKRWPRAPVNRKGKRNRRRGTGETVPADRVIYHQSPDAGQPGAQTLRAVCACLSDHPVPPSSCPRLQLSPHHPHPSPISICSSFWHCFHTAGTFLAWSQGCFSRCCADTQCFPTAGAGASHRVPSHVERSRDGMPCHCPDNPDTYRPCGGNKAVFQREPQLHAPPCLARPKILPRDFALDKYPCQLPPCTGASTVHYADQPCTVFDI
jgi:hypothetical protein